MKLPGMILQVFPSIIKDVEGELFIDVDWLYALRFYVENFEKVVFACPVSKNINSVSDSGLDNCQSIKSLPSWASELEILPLPYAYKPHKFIQYYSETRETLRQYIKNANYLEFSPSSLIGDWATLASLEAIKMGRSYAISADIVYADRMRFNLKDDPFWKRHLKEIVSISPFDRYYSHILRNSGLALFQGQAVYDAYSGFQKNSHQIYFVTMTRDERIKIEQLNHQITQLMDGRHIKVCYAGRATSLKGPLDWIYTLHKAIKNGANIRATWIGDGSLLDEMKSLSQTLNISEHIQFSGFVSDRETLLEFLRESDIFLYCHKTRESARCLMEALGTGCALVGYEGEYPKGLVQQYGGALFAPANDWEKLSQLLVELNSDRTQLCNLVQDAYNSGMLHDRETALMYRINLIKNFYGASLDVA